MEYQYEIQCRIETLANIAVSSNAETLSFLSDEILFSHWDRDPLSNSHFWLAKVNVKAGSKDNAISSFNNKMARQIPQIAFISQCYIEFACQPFLVKRFDKNFAYFRYVRESEAVGLMFGDTEKQALDALIINTEIPESFYFYWNDAINTHGYSSKILLLCAALDAMGKVGLSREDRKYKEKFYRTIEEIIGPELMKVLWGTKQNPNSGLRQRLVHGEYFGQDDFEMNYVDCLHKSIIRYFNESILKQNLLDENVVAPQRHIRGSLEAYQNYIGSKEGNSLELRELVAEIDENGINNLIHYEWVDNAMLYKDY